MSDLCLVTGANGFIGSALVENLSGGGWRVRKAVRSARAVSQAEVAVGNIDGATDWSVALHGVSVVVHTAARVHVMNESSADPYAEFLRINRDATLNLARQCVAAGVKRFIFLSSIKVNGEFTKPGQPFTAEDDCRPLDAYGRSKLEAERALLNLTKESGLEVVIIRPPLVYGPGVKANFLSMIRWIYRGIPLPFGAIHNSRSLVALGNLVDLIALCLEHPAAANQVFLVSDGESISTSDLLRRISKALGVKSRLLPVPGVLLDLAFVVIGRKDLGARLCGSLQVDISKTRTLLGWTPPLSIDAALAETAEYFMGRLDG